MKLFRKMRLASLEENNPSAYLKYAFGEVVFVVVGILLAFQIDTWSERRNAKEHTHYLFDQVQSELAMNILNCNLLLGQYRGKDTLVHDILYRRVTRQDYRDHWEYGLVLLTQQEAEVSVEAFLNLGPKDHFVGAQSTLWERQEIFGFGQRDCNEQHTELPPTIQGRTNMVWRSLSESGDARRHD